MNSNESDIPSPGIVNNIMYFYNVSSFFYSGIGSTPLGLEIFMAIVGGCLTLIVTGAVLVIILVRCMTKKKPRSRKLRTGETPGPISDHCPPTQVI